MTPPTNTKIMVPLTWIEHVTSPLPRECSTTELQGHYSMNILDIHTQKETGAGEGNRTLVISLEGFSSTIELHPPKATTSATTFSWWRGLDSNQRTRKRADLQSAAINHSATPPQGIEDYEPMPSFCQHQSNTNLHLPPPTIIQHAYMPSPPVEKDTSSNVRPVNYPRHNRQSWTTPAKLDKFRPHIEARSNASGLTWPR